MATSARFLRQAMTAANPRKARKWRYGDFKGALAVTALIVVIYLSLLLFSPELISPSATAERRGD
ncbi:hypothetical protein [Streptomyces sp. NPDC001568]|uniref:hypothetical protein n=1 Tax=Streptomyces sp. NPDC001568 TaxID=3364588 RepID=UPI00368A6E35